MASFDVGMKVYDNDWYLKYGLSYDEAAGCLRDWGVTFVLAPSKVAPMPDSAVKSEVAPELAERYAAYDDRMFRNALSRYEIEYWSAVCMFFDPPALQMDPALCPVGSDGRPMEKIDWYVGIAPSHEAHISRKVAAIERVVEELEPDGVFMAFTRWPGFWELWTPHHERQEFPEYSYDAHTLQRFSREAGLALPVLPPAEVARWLDTCARDTWTDWKCGLIFDVVRQVKEAGARLKPGLRIMLNTVPFGADDFLRAGECVFGQRWEALSTVVDVFEVMAYHQILKRPVSWITAIGEEVKARSGRKTVCTLQAKPLYVDGMHAQERRSSTLEVEEFAAMVQAVEKSSIDGIVVFVWSDFLDQVLGKNDRRRIDVIEASASRRRARLD